MLFWIEIDGDRVAVQAVNRKPKPYWRLAPYTIVYPTPRQRAVRNTVSIAAHMAVDGTQEDINLNVKDAFKGWEYTPQYPNKTYMTLKSIYGDQADDVLNYIQTQKRVEQKLNRSQYRQRLEMEVLKAMEVPQ